MIRIPGGWWSKLMNWMTKRAPRGKAMVLRPNPAKQAPVSQHRKCKTKTGMVTRVEVSSALEAEIEEDPRWSEDYTSVESRLAVSLRSERGGSGKPRPADCRLRMRGFGDDCDSSTGLGLVVLSHRPTLLKERDT
ncbi:hypothetical protein QBC45DRAFT_452190 [Copromyces sp. CBS 386.78]|nr:hypothetical protein QBC45DRAFT_452190 [Copromyces sp. CBS 386.78]